MAGAEAGRGPACDRTTSTSLMLGNQSYRQDQCTYLYMHIVCKSMLEDVRGGVGTRETLTTGMPVGPRVYHKKSFQNEKKLC